MGLPVPDGTNTKEGTRMEGKSMKRKTAQRTFPKRPSFDITRVVGTVILDEEGDKTPFEAAFEAVAKDVELTGCADGTFQFPSPNGDLCVIHVGFLSSTNGHQDS